MRVSVDLSGSLFAEDGICVPQESAQSSLIKLLLSLKINLSQCMILHKKLWTISLVVLAH